MLGCCRKQEVVRSKAVIRSGYLYKKSLKQGPGVRVGKAWQRRWFVLEVETNGGDDGATVVRTGKLTYYQSNKDTKEGVEIPLHETMAVKGAIGKTKGTEHRVTVATPKREFELGCDDKSLADSWIADLQQWIGELHAAAAAAASPPDTLLLTHPIYPALYTEPQDCQRSSGLRARAVRAARPRYALHSSSIAAASRQPSHRP